MNDFINRLSTIKNTLLLIPVLFFVHISPVLAGVNCTYSGTYYIYLPSSTVYVGRDAKPGDLIGPWISTSAAPAWTCFRTTTDYGIIRIGIAGYSPYAVYGTTTVDGANYSIYYSAVKAGLGYIARWRSIYQGVASEWQALNGTGWRNPETLFGPIEYDNQNTFPLNIDVQVQFVKTSNSLTSGAVSAFDPLYVRPHITLNNGGLTEIGPYRIVDYAPWDLTIASGGTCTTPDVNVTFPKVAVNSFNGIGSTAAKTPFSLLFNNCPAGLHGIGYSFSPTTSVVDMANGVVALDASSTATGIGIQLLTGANVPISYGTVYPLNEYNPEVAGSYTVPLEAAMYQISSQVTAGTVKGSITFTLDYK